MSTLPTPSPVVPPALDFLSDFHPPTPTEAAACQVGSLGNRTLTIADLQNKIAVKLLNRILAEDQHDHLCSRIGDYRQFAEATARIGTVSINPNSIGE